MIQRVLIKMKFLLTCLAKPGLISQSSLPVTEDLTCLIPFPVHVGLGIRSCPNFVVRHFQTQR